MAARSTWWLLPAGWALLALGCPGMRVYPTPQAVPMSVFPGGSIADRSWDGAFPAGGVTLHVAPGGSDAGDGSAAAPFASVQAALDQVAPGDTVLVHAGAYGEAVVVTRSGTADAWVRLLGDGAVLSGGGVSIDGASYVVVTGLEVRDAPGVGIAVRGGHDVVVQNDRVSGSGAAGIAVEGAGAVTLRGNTVTGAWRQPGAAGAGIAVSGANGFLVLRNEVYGIRATAPAGEAGGGGIEVVGPGGAGAISGNWVHDLHGDGIAVESGAGALAGVDVLADRVWACADAVVVSARGGGSVSGVRVLNVAAWGNAGAGVRVSAAGLDGPRSGIVVGSDTLVGNGAGGVRLETLQLADATVRNVLAADNGGSQLFAAAPGAVTADHDLVHGPAAALGELGGAGVVQAAPRFLRAAGYDLRLASGSPAIDAGSPDGAPDTDLDGRSRPLGVGIDIGAYEVR